MKAPNGNHAACHDGLSRGPHGRNAGGIRLLQATMLSAIVALSISVVTADDQADESAMIQRVELLGARVTRDANQAGQPVVAVRLGPESRFADADLSRMKALSMLILKGSRQISDAGIRELETLATLKQLNVAYCKNITKEGLKALQDARTDLEITR